ncbi:ATP-binding cassette domain-containing protein [Sphingobacteriales bacterium CHB3]|nr:ATP-binding cassette domain-containing protein [Sphingobacteriales bacterium CHB3]
MLRVANLRKDFSSIRAVDGVSFDVERGQIFGLIGRNGAGKTTTIRMVLNILQPDADEITFDAKPFSDQTRNIIGYLPEERGLYKKSKLLDTILYFSGLRAMHHHAAKAEAKKWLDRFSLMPYADKKVEELSKGNQQKVQFITSIIHDPQLIVLDEPFSGLDPVNQILFKDIFLDLKQKSKAIIFSTHQMDQAEKLSDEICLIHHGRVVLNGSIRDVKKRYGSNSVHLEFEGDGAFLRSLPGLKDVIMYENSAELQFADGFNPQQILPEIAAKLELRKYELREPSLESIFIQTVGEKEEAKA